MCSASPPGSSTFSTNRHTTGQQESSAPARQNSFAKLQYEGVDPKTFALFIERAKGSREINALNQPQLGSSKAFTAENQINKLLQADRQRLEELAIGHGTLQAIHPFLEAERERYKRLAEMAIPHHQLLESLTLSTNILQGIGQEFYRPLREAAESHSRVLRQVAEGMNSEVLKSAAALSSLHIPARIHALPPSLHTGSWPGNNSLLIPTPEKPSELETKPPRLTEEAQAQHLLSILSRFLESKEITSDAKEGLASAIAWFKLNKGRPSQLDGQKLNILIRVFLRDQQGLSTPPEFQQLLSSGLLVAQPNNPTAAPELDPRIYTSLELAGELNYTEGNIRRMANAVWIGSNLPRPLRKFPEWYVVAQGRPEGGRGCGWTFQKRRFAATNQI